MVVTRPADRRETQPAARDTRGQFTVHPGLQSAPDIEATRNLLGKISRIRLPVMLADRKRDYDFATRSSIQEEAMLKLVLGAALAAAIVIPGSLYSSPAVADGGYRKHHRHHVHHRWGDRDWEIIRWSNGDCKIWFDDNGPPWGVEGRDWTVLAANLRSYDEAWRALVRLQGLRMCL
jgi:hypothetical protein